MAASIRAAASARRSPTVSRSTASPPAARSRRRSRGVLRTVGLDPSHAERYPHEFSGGQRQRIGIARALAPDPAFLVADEPVSSLDVSIQAQIMELLDRVRHERKLALLFISHDLPVVRQLSDRVLIMYLGRIVEAGPAATVLGTPGASLYARPRLGDATHRGGKRPSRIILPGDPPSPSAPPSGCAFRTRCAHAVDACAARRTAHAKARARPCRGLHQTVRDRLRGSDHRDGCHAAQGAHGHDHRRGGARALSRRTRSSCCPWAVTRIRVRTRRWATICWPRRSPSCPP